MIIYSMEDARDFLSRFEEQKENHINLMVKVVDGSPVVFTTSIEGLLNMMNGNFYSVKLLIPEKDIEIVKACFYPWQCPFESLPLYVNVAPLIVGWRIKKGK